MPIPAETWRDLEKADAILFGAVGDPRVNDATYLAGVLLRLRFELDLYVNLRPAKLYDDRLSPLRREDRRIRQAHLQQANQRHPRPTLDGHARPALPENPWGQNRGRSRHPNSAKEERRQVIQANLDDQPR